MRFRSLLFITILLAFCSIAYTYYETFVQKDFDVISSEETL